VEDVNDSASAGAQLAGLAVEVRHLAMAIERVSADVKELRSDVDGLRVLVDRGRGAWATMAMFGTIGAGAVGIAAWVFEHLIGKAGV
jgi:hypothetical protein